MTYYKLTNENAQSYGGTQWGPGVTHKASGKGVTFCSEDYIHLYDDLLLAVLLNPIHANFKKPRAWLAEVEGDVASDYGLKFGAKKVTTVREVPLPVITRTQLTAFAILVALEAYHEPSWVLWANKWLTGEDRTTASADAAYRTLYPITTAATTAATIAAVDATACADAAYAYGDADAAYACADAATAVVLDAASSATDIDLKAIAQKAMAVKEVKA